MRVNINRMACTGRDNFRDIAEEVLRTGNDLAFSAGGVSMSPFIKDGETVVISRTGNVRTGDVVLFRNPAGRLLLHRVVGKTGEGVITKGDGCLSDDGFTSNKDILGKVIRISGRGRRLFLMFPLNLLIAKGVLHPARLRGLPLLFPLLKKFASVVGLA